MDKHTPGPWAIDASKSFYVFGPARLSEQAGLEHGPFICNASSQANALLIAAAPAMLLALQELIAEREAYNPTGGILLALDAVALATKGAT